MTMKNYWYVACPSSQLGTQPVATRIFDQPIALYRDTQGQAAALEDRCCHRGVELSRGCVTAQGRLACAYHGWEYDGSGRCVHVPSFTADTRVPEGFKVRSYPCCEQDHYVWVWMGDGEPAGRPEPIHGAHEYAWRQGTVPVRCNAVTFLENMLDGAHAVFTPLFNHTYVPACSVPCGVDRHGLPIGAQVVGPLHADARVLALAAWVEALSPHDFAALRVPAAS